MYVLIRGRAAISTLVQGVELFEEKGRGWKGLCKSNRMPVA
jgi:hypothetical protein